MLKQIVKSYNEAIYDTDRDKALQVVRKAVEDGVSPEEVVFKIIMPAMDLMMNAVSLGEDVNLAQHFMTAQIASEVTEEMIPKFKKAPSINGKIVIGTAQGDLHSLGKRIVVGCLSTYMIDVTDLGVNVPPERFVDEALVHNANVIGISSMMVHTAKGENGCVKVRQILKERGLEDTIKIIVGGAPYKFNSDLYKIVQADAWAEDGISAGKIILNMIKESQK